MQTGVNRQIGEQFVPEPRITTPRVANNRVRRPPARPWMQQTQRAAREAPAWMVRGYMHANASDLAAAVAFNALVALVPGLLLLAAIIGATLHDAMILDRAVGAILWSRAPGSTTGALTAIVDVRQNLGWYGLLSLIGFAWVGTNFVSCIARSMNRVYGVPNRRFVHERARAFFVIIAFAALNIVASFAVTVPTLLVNRNIGLYFEDWTIISGPAQVASYAVGSLAAVALFFLLYRVVPNAGQRLADVWPGTLTAAALFVLLSQVFPLYLRFFTLTSQYAKVLGFGLVLVIWFYALSHVLLFGTYVNATHHWRRHRRARYFLRRLTPRDEEPASQPRNVLPIKQ